MTHFTPWSALFGGMLIGVSASILFLWNGRIAGISGILGGLVERVQGETAWRGWFLAGLVLGGVALEAFAPARIGESTVSLPLTVVAGLLVGFGTRLGNGCTSGHGVCGISRGSKRSVTATMVFMATGGIAAFVVRHVLGGAS